MNFLDIIMVLVGNLHILVKEDFINDENEQNYIIENDTSPIRTYIYVRRIE